MKRTVGAALLAGLWATGACGSGSIPARQVVSVVVQPWPEGPASPSFSIHSDERRTFLLSLIQKDIPDPLPSTLSQPADCTVGQKVTFRLADGRDVVYGPCRRPREIQRFADVVTIKWEQLEKAFGLSH